MRDPKRSEAQRKELLVVELERKELPLTERKEPPMSRMNRKSCKKRSFQFHRYRTRIQRLLRSKLR